MANDEEGVPCALLPLAFLPDGALGLVLSFGSVPELIAANMVCAFHSALVKSLSSERRTLKYCVCCIVSALYSVFVLVL